MTTATRPKSDSRAAELADLVERLTARIQAREPIDFDAVRREHPEHAEELERLIPALALLADFSHSPGAAIRGEGESEFGTLGDFRLIREVGRGGMGIVYEAEQISLNRRVALKVLPFAATMDPRHMQRFKNEALAAASLRHENIVHVYGVGCERGVHYYAMELIEGQTLAEVIHPSRERERPNACHSERSEESTGPREGASRSLAALGMTNRDTAPNALLSTKRDRAHFRTIATLIASAADALEYAHSMGVVHRDIKPGNIMLDFSPLPASGRGAGGEGCHLWITDFGLAKLANPADLASPDRRIGDNLTLTGDLIGTLRYMSPEQALAKHGLVDHRTDIYSLGATLYELLTLKPAVPGNDKAEILKSIAWDEPTPLRTHDKSIPAELETITLKCLAKEPGERYATAGELAEDLRRWLGDKTIKAKPPGWREKAAKWGRRHRGVVASAATIFLVAVAAVSIGSLLLWRKSNELQQAYEGELRQRQRANANWRQALEALEKVHLDLVETRFPAKAALDPADRELVNQILKYFENFVASNADEPAVLHEALHGYHAIGDLYRKLGDHNRALEPYRQAISRARILIQQSPEDYHFQRDLAASLGNLAISQMQLGKASEAETSLRESIRVENQFLPKLDTDHRFWDGHAESLIVLGSLLSHSKRFAEAREHLNRAEEIRRRLVERVPNSLDFRRGLGNTFNLLGCLSVKTGDLNKGADYLLQSADLFERLAVQFPNAPEVRGLLAQANLNLLLARTNIEDFDANEKSVKRAIDELRQLTLNFPGMTDYQSNLAKAHNNYGILLSEKGRKKDSEIQYEYANVLLEKLVETYPDQPEHRWLLAGVVGQRADAKMQRQDSKGWLELAERALAHARLAAKAQPEASNYQVTLALSLRRVAHARDAVNDRAGAAAMRHEALTFCESAAARFPDEIQLLEGVGVEATHIARPLIESGKSAERRVFLHKALSAYERLLTNSPDNDKYLEQFATLCHVLGNTDFVENQAKSCEEWCMKSLKACHKLLELRSPKDVFCRRQLLLCRKTLCQNYLRQTNYAAADPAMRETIAELRVFLETAGDDKLTIQHQLAQQLNNLAFVLTSVHAKHEEAIRCLDEAIQNQEAVVKSQPFNLVAKTFLRNHYDSKAFIILTSPNAPFFDPRVSADCARKALALDSSFGSAYYNLGRALIHLGDDREAVRTLEKGSRFIAEEDKASTWQYLCTAHNRLGNWPAAVLYFCSAEVWAKKHNAAEEPIQRRQAELATMLGIKHVKQP